MKAMILAAGRGERLRPLTDTTPKPLLKVAGKSLIEYHVENLVKSGFKDIVVNHAYLGEQIEQTLNDGSSYGARIQYSREKTALETGGGIKKALPMLGDANFIVVNADIWTNYDFSNLSKSSNSLIHLVLVNNPEHNQSGDFGIDESQLCINSESMLTYSGIGVYHVDVFKENRNGKFKLAPLIRQFAKLKEVTAEHFVGEWIDVGTVERLAQLESRLSS